MDTEKQTHKNAAKFSKEEGEAQYVVWVFDHGRHIYNAEQVRRYGPLLHVEAVYIDGVKVAAEMVTA